MKKKEPEQHNKVPMTYEERRKFIFETIAGGDSQTRSGMEAQADAIAERWDDDVDVNRSEMFYEGYQI